MPLVNFDEIDRQNAFNERMQKTIGDRRKNRPMPGMSVHGRHMSLEASDPGAKINNFLQPRNRFQSEKQHQRIHALDSRNDAWVDTSLLGLGEAYEIPDSADNFSNVVQSHFTQKRADEQSRSLTARRKNRPIPGVKA